GERRSWNFLWRRRLFQWEEECVTHLLASLENVCLTHEDDKWRWSFDPEGNFSVKSAYDSLVKEIVVGPNISVHEEYVFKHIWDSPAPSKVLAFSWQLLYDRVPTKENLLLR
ncbi:hypothetical protein A2U01_0039584, partial [Trifolium medium]|nr:hypothetical protein [Trifolium medium]